MTIEVPTDEARVLIFSLRNVFQRDLFRGPHYEFEDIISEIDSAVLLAPEADPSGTHFRFATQLAYHAPVTLNPGIRRVQARTDYDIFFAICAFPQDLILVNAVTNIRDICRTSMCLLDEIWIKDIVKHRHFLRILHKFDVVLLFYSQTVKPLGERIGRRCLFLPPSVDAISFCPYPDPPKRVVDVCSIGRRSEITHQRLLRMVRERRLFYLHDSIGGHQAIDLKEHRALLANVAKRSRYFIVNPALIDEPTKRGNQIEIGSRFFEGAASGAIMIGERPNNEEFARLFDWPDAMTPLPYDSCDIDMVIADLDGDPERQDRIRRTNVLQALMRHDWVYRWEAILKIAGLEPMRGVLERKERLTKLAEVVLQNEGDTDGQSHESLVFPVTTACVRLGG